MKNKGFTILELMTVILIVGILTLIAIPSFQSQREHAYDASAQSASYNCKVAEELFFQASGGSVHGYYATTLTQLTPWDKNLNKDRGVTFLFQTDGYSSGYTFTTHHSPGTTTSQGYFVVSN